jgi:rhodanese-related sulfurtransferase
MATTIAPLDLKVYIGTPGCPAIIAVTRHGRFMEEHRRIAGSLWRDHMKSDEWAPLLGGGRKIVVYCAQGHNVSQIAAARLDAAGYEVAYLEGGIEAFEQAGGPVIRKTGPGVPLDLQVPTVWVTRKRPKIDRIACPWLIRRFIDPAAVFHYVDPQWVVDIAEEIGGIPYDIDGVHYSHRGENCSFDTILTEFGLDEPALLHLARIVRGADTAVLDLEPQCAGLLAMSLGLSAAHANDLEQLEQGMVLYDALYSWCRNAVAETHNWPTVKQ